MVKKWLMLSIFVLFSSSVFSQEKFKVLPFIPQNQLKERELERRIELEMESIRNSGYFTSIQKSLALRKEDLSLCESDEECKEDVQNLLPVRYFAEGRCEEIKNSLERELCYALKSNNCNSLSGWKKDFCKGIVTKDVDLLSKVSRSPDLIKEIGISMTKEDILEMLGIYYGFKYYSPVSCETGFGGRKDLLEKKMICQIIFSSDSEEAVEKILRDLALFSISRKENDRDICDFIKNKDIKDKCLNPSIKSIREFW